MAQPFLEGFSHRPATGADTDEIAALMDAAIGELQRGFLSPEQITVARSIMGLDRQLIADSTYFIVHETASGRLAASGGWSRRATLYGGDHSTAQRNAALLRMGADAARIRAMYTHPDFTRRGLGRYVLSVCEQAAHTAGFTHVELMATLAGEPLYRACGYSEIERIISASTGGIDVPGLRMGKVI
ncbi:MAG: GNAT family N-acetyltransferase [Hyphomonas sp.]|uniref:GNAT family N-acetyltransferase n=1 Tax=Hyphomonas sp. TaxID=87 RepID=UPI0034A027A5